MAEQFHWADYLVFAAMLAVSAAIGVYHWVRGRHKADADRGEDYLLGSRTMKPLPVALSINSSFMSAISILSMPGELYFFGFTYFYYLFAYVFGFIVTSQVFIPLIHPLNLTSGYEYLEMRFNSTVRKIGSLTFLIMTILYMGVALFTPALAFSQVTGLSLLVSILGAGAVCTFYTALGGIKAVVWTDAFQAVVILLGLITLAIKGAIDSGGVNNAWDVAKAEGRLDPTNGDVHLRSTFWTQVIGGSFLMLTFTGSNQTSLQRYQCLPSTKAAQRATFYSLWISLINTVLLLAVGVSMVAYYQGCDPLTNKEIGSKDQLVALYMMHVLGDYPGLPGVFTACTFSGALSTVSSGINSLAAVLVQDIMQPIAIDRGLKLKDSTWNHISLSIVVIFGCLTVGIAFASQFFGDTVLTLALSIFGIAGGPLLGVFLLALIPMANSKGALAGLLCSLVFSFWIGLGAILNPSGSSYILPLNTTMCHVPNVTSTTVAMTTQAVMDTTTMTRTPPLQDFYNVSYMWYALFAVIVVLTVGIPVSALTGCNKKHPIEVALWNPCFERTKESNENEFQNTNVARNGKPVKNEDPTIEGIDNLSLSTKF